MEKRRYILNVATLGITFNFVYCAVKFLKNSGGVQKRVKQSALLLRGGSENISQSVINWPSGFWLGASKSINIRQKDMDFLVTLSARTPSKTDSTVAQKQWLLSQQESIPQLIIRSCVNVKWTV